MESVPKSLGLKNRDCSFSETVGLIKTLKQRLGKTDSTRLHLPLSLFLTTFPSGIHWANETDKKDTGFSPLPPSLQLLASNSHTLTTGTSYASCEGQKPYVTFKST